MAKRAFYSVVAVVGIAAAGGAAWWYQNKPASSPTQVAAPGPGAAGPSGAASGARPGGGGPVTVEAAQVQVTRLTDDTQAVGSLRSRQSVVLRPEVGGRVTQLNFRDGERVRKGQLLVQFDDQLPLAQVQQSQAEMSIAQANHKRNQELVAQNFISQRSVDESAAALQVAQAKLALSQATAARYKIVAPFDGITGIRTVNIGDYLKDGADIVNIEDLEAIYVDFRLPERFHSKIRRGQQSVVSLDALPGRKFSAVVLAVDPLLDANGRSVAVRGCIDNRQLQLRPGMFARVNTVFGERERALVVPEEAVLPQGARHFVLRLADGPDARTRTTQRVEVKVGVRQPGKVEILEGLNEGDAVVTAGHQRVQRDGTVVKLVDLPRGEALSGAGPGNGNGPGNGAGKPTAAVASASSAAPGKPAGPVGPNPCLAQMAQAEIAPLPGRGGDARPGGRGPARNPA